jgi:parvulin-like peptidyl-prolyl isomerase
MRGRKWTVRGMIGQSAVSSRQSAVSRRFLTAYCLLLGAAGGVIGQTPDAGGKPAAIVNGEAIPMSVLETMMKQDGPMPVAVPESVRKQQMQVAMSALINETLMRQFLKKNAPPVDPKDVDARMSDLAAGLRQQNKSLADFCRDSKQTPEQIRANVAAVLQWNAFAHGRINDQDIEKYYRDNKDFFDKKQVHAAEIMLRVTSQADKAERERMKAQLAELRAKILKNEITFGQAAKQYSQGPTKDQGEGGDLEWFPHYKGILPESLLQAAFTLPPGQISEVVDSDYGVHLIKVIEKKDGEPSDFNKIKEDVRQIRIEEMQQEILRDLRQSAEKAGQIQVLLQ